MGSLMKIRLCFLEEDSAQIEDDRIVSVPSQMLRTYSWFAAGRKTWERQLKYTHMLERTLSVLSLQSNLLVCY